MVDIILGATDCDLSDSEEVYFKAHSDVCRRFNKTYTKEVKMKVMGTQPNLSAKTIVDTLNINITPEAYRAEYEKLIGQRLISIDFMPGKSLALFIV